MRAGQDDMKSHSHQCGLVLPLPSPLSPITCHRVGRKCWKYENFHTGRVSWKESSKFESFRVGRHGRVAVGRNAVWTRYAASSASYDEQNDDS